MKECTQNAINFQQDLQLYF